MQVPLPLPQESVRRPLRTPYQNLGLAVQVGSEYYPIRMTAYKSLLDRAKIGGTALPKLSREVLAEVLNECLKLYSADALLLIRDEKSLPFTPVTRWIIPSFRSTNC